MSVHYSAIKLTRALPQTGQLRMVSIPGNSHLNDRLNPQRHTCQWPTRPPPAALADVKTVSVSGLGTRNGPDVAQKTKKPTDWLA